MNDRSTVRELWRFIKPEPEELIAYTLIIFIMLGIALYQVAIQGYVGTEPQSLIAAFDTGKDTLLDYFSQDDKWGRFFLFGLWFIIGTVVYMLSWSLVTIIVDISNDIRISSSFAHPKSFHRSEYWLAIGSRTILRGSAALTLVFYSVFWLSAFAPVWLNSFMALFTGGFSTDEASNALAALLGIALTLHIAAILLRIALLRAHYSYEQ